MGHANAPEHTGTQRSPRDHVDTIAGNTPAHADALVPTNARQSAHGHARDRAYATPVSHADSVGPTNTRQSIAHSNTVGHTDTWQSSAGYADTTAGPAHDRAHATITHSDAVGSTPSHTSARWPPNSHTPAAADSHPRGNTHNQRGARTNTVFRTARHGHDGTYATTPSDTNAR